MYSIDQSPLVSFPEVVRDEERTMFNESATQNATKLSHFH